MIIDELYKILKDSYDVDISLINENTKIRDYLDSLDYLGFLTDVRKKYHLRLDPDNFPGLQTLNQVQELIKRETGKE